MLEVEVRDNAVRVRLGAVRGSAALERGEGGEVGLDVAWRALVTAGAEVLDAYDRARPERLVVRTLSDTLAVWDQETLGAATAALTLPWRAAELDPRTQAWVEEGRCVVGSLESYLVARLTRGTWHVTSPGQARRTGLLHPGSGSWDEAACAAAGLPVTALPEVVDEDPLGRTDAASFLGVAALVSLS